MNPKVSIVIPVYNGSNYLADAIDSALAQTYNNIEVLVINDGSKDQGATEKIAKSYGNKIRYFYKENGGVASALNMGIEKMKGEYFSWLSHDDMYSTNKVKAQIDYLKSKGLTDAIVACNAKVLFENGLTQSEKIDKNLFNFFDVFLSVSGDIGVNGCSLLIHKNAFKKAGIFNENLPTTQDYDLWYRMSKFYQPLLLDRCMVISRRHNEQDSITKSSIAFDESESLHSRLIEEIGHDRFMLYLSKYGTEKMWKMYLLYRSNNYIITASKILDLLAIYSKKYNDNQLDRLINNERGKVVKSYQIFKNRKTIIFYNNVWATGGISKVLNYVFEAISDSYNLILVTQDNNDYTSTYEVNPYVTHIKIIGEYSHTKIFNIINKYNADIFIGNPNFDPVFLEIYKLLKNSNTKTIAYNHGHILLPYVYPHLYPVAIKIKEFYPYADRVIWLSKIANKIHSLSYTNGVYLPNPIEKNVSFNKKKKFSKKLLAVGRFDDEIKRIDRVLLIFKYVLDIDPEYSLDIVGNCPMDFVLNAQKNMTIEMFIEYLKIPKTKLTFTGSTSEVSKHYNKSDVFLMTSECEGFGMTLTEALSHGLPCVCFDYIGIEEIVDNGMTGWISSDEKYLAQKIIELGNNHTLYSTMSKSAQLSVEKYSFEKFKNNWMSLIGFLLEEDNSKLEKSTSKREYITKEESEKTIHEMEKVMLSLAKNFIDSNSIEYGQNSNDFVSSKIIKYKKWKHRLMLSIQRHGIIHTMKKMLYKILRKLKSMIKIMQLHR